MRIYVRSREGYYNMCNPSEKSISTHIAIMNDEKRIMYCNIRTEDILESNSPENAICEIDAYLKRILYTSDRDNIKAVRNFIDKHYDDLDLGNDLYELEQLKRQRIKLNEKITNLQIRIDKIELEKELTS